MGKLPREVPAEWNLREWERALNIHVGSAHVCRECGNVVMVCRGGVGVMELECCGRPMERVAGGERERAS